MDTLSQPQVIHLHDGVGSGFCGAYPEDDDQFTYRLCLRNTTSPSSHNECEAFSTCCECGSCNDPAILAITNFTSQITLDSYNRQICNFSATSEVIVSCHGRRNGVPGAAYQVVSVHVVREETKSIKMSSNKTLIIVSAALGALVVVLVVFVAAALIAITVFRRKLRKYRAQSHGVGERRRAVDDREEGDPRQNRHVQRNPQGQGTCTVQ